MRINFQISDTNYSVDADGSNYTLIRHGINQKKGDNLGKPTEAILGYHNLVKSAVSRAVKDQLGSQPDEITLREFIERYEAATEMVSNQIGEK